MIKTTPLPTFVAYRPGVQKLFMGTDLTEHNYSYKTHVF